MIKSWHLGAALFASIALNVILSFMVVGKNVPAALRPTEIVMERINALPSEDKKKALVIFEHAKPLLEAKMDELKSKRIATFQYIQSGAYKREDAEKKIEELRVLTSAVQQMAQTMVLDIADQLPENERKQLLSYKGITTP